MKTIRKKPRRNAVKQQKDNQGIAMENPQHGREQEEGQRRRAAGGAGCGKNWDEDHREQGETQKDRESLRKTARSRPNCHMRKSEDQRAKKSGAPSGTAGKQPHKEAKPRKA